MGFFGLGKSKNMDADEVFDQAVEAYEAENYKKAFKLFRQAAELGSRSAWSNLGFLYGNGVGVGEDEVKALECYQRAAIQGDAFGQFNCGMCYEDGMGTDVDLERAFFWYERAAGQDVKEALYYGGKMLMDGRGVARNPAKARDWLTRAAEQGHTEAEFACGQISESSRFGRHLWDALSWYQKAEAHGHEEAKARISKILPGVFRETFLAAASLDPKAKEASKTLVRKYNGAALKFFDRVELGAHGGEAEYQFLFGYLHLCGDLFYGKRKNEEASARWFLKAAEQGHPMAQYYCGRFYTRGVMPVIPRDREKAFSCYRQAAEHGIADAQYLCADFYFYGRCTDRDYGKYIDLIQKAAAQDHSDAQYKLAQAYEHDGFGVEKDLEKAFFWYQKSALLENDRAQLRLGEMYAQGTGTEQDTNMAVVWLQKAVDNGNTYAAEELYEIKTRASKQ